MYRSILFLLASLLIFSGCSNDNSIQVIIGNNLFPLSTGNKLEYNMYDLDSSFTKIPDTDKKFTREIGSPVYIDGFNAYPVYETTTKDNSVISRDTTYVHKTADDAIIKYYLKVVLPITDNSNITFNKWVNVFQRGSSIESYYTIIDTTVTVQTTLSGKLYPVPLNIHIQNIIFNEETVSVPANTNGYKSNKIEMYYEMRINGVVLRSGTYYQLWLVEGIGPVKERKTFTEKMRGSNIELTAKTIK